MNIEPEISWDNDWHHYVFSVDINGYSTIYRNGILIISDHNLDDITYNGNF